MSGTHVSFLSSPMFESPWPEYELSWPVVFIHPTNSILDKCLERGHDIFLSHYFSGIIYINATVLRYTISVVETASLNEKKKIQSNSRQQKISISSYTSYRMRMNCYGNLRTRFCASKPTSVSACQCHSANAPCSYFILSPSTVNNLSDWQRR